MRLLTRRSEAKKQYRRQKLIVYLLSGASIVVLSIFVFVFILFAWFSKDLPAPGKVQRTSGFSTVFYDREGKIIYEMFKDKNRIPVTLSQTSEYLKKATIAIEDKNFYTHSGFSSTGIIRAIFAIVLKGRLEGGSTLTQQLVKNVLLTPERSLTRKVKEFILALEIERRYDKDQILELYLNEAPYGGTFWGVESASKGYFGKEARSLNLPESAVIAGLPQRPSYYSPFIGKEKVYIARAKDVLRRMREDGHINKTQEKEAVDELPKLQFSSGDSSLQAPHFIFYVRDQIASQYGEEILASGLKIKTTLSLKVQKFAEDVVKEEIEKVTKLNATNGAVVVLDSKTGEILAMVGSYDYADEKYGKFNTTTALRQPGSSVKPITYALAFEKGYTPSTVLMDVKTSFGSQGNKEYIPENYDGKFRGPIQLRFALGNSINIPAIKLLSMVGIRDFAQKAYDMGLTTLEPTSSNLERFGLSLTLGGGEVRLVELTSAFSVFARGGTYKEHSSIMELKDYKNKTIPLVSSTGEKRVLSEEASFLVSHILSDNNARSEAFGSSSFLVIPGKTVAVKTGTTDDKRDNWAIGYTKGVAVGVWVGNNDNSPMSPRIASGTTGASPIWHRVMRELLKTYPDGIVDKPERVEAFEIDSYLGGLPHEGYPKRSEYFVKGTEPHSVSSFYKKIKISKNTGKIANEVEIKKGEYEEKEFIALTEKDPISTDGVNRWQQGIDAWLTTQSDNKFKYPSETSDAKTDEVVVRIHDPSDNARINSTSVTIKAQITSIASLKKVEIFANGSLIQTFNEDKKTIEEPLTLSDGVYELKVRAENTNGKSSEATVRIGVNMDYAVPTMTPTMTPIPSV